MAKNKENIVGFDVGTGTLVSAKLVDNDLIETNNLRNMYVIVNEDIVSANQLSNTKLEYISKHDENGDIEFNAIIGNDCHMFSNIYNKSVKRPMKDGIISNLDYNSDIIITAMIEKLLDKNKNGGICTYSIPAKPIDKPEINTDYHEMKFKTMFERMGFTTVKSLNESMAIVYSELSDNNFSGLALSFGAGMTNVCLSYRGIPAISFSICRGGDWIDENSAKALNIIENRIINIKEKPEMDITNPQSGNKKQQREREAISFYYKSLIEYVIDNFMKEFDKVSDNLEIDDTIPIVISGGTSLVNGFIPTFEEKFKSYKNFPYEISEIKHAKNPLTAVANGCLIHSQFVKSKG